ncbi:hypothetical protein GRX03_08760 [Halovenus sp. WSH3]|uniref:Uncharacterized protein n=1 Tax=Halovenus carboxidivorans TaxID=2692199 RepID=A0A6B0T8X5_9EURY|nr:hypothetical protein [Halovenus carboxidivorans]MXR51691.1 hypothetical protein [Halovenus carboxidivorans]
MTDLRQFVKQVAVLLLVAFALGAVLTPPNPTTQLSFAAGAIPVVFATAYVLASRTDGEQFPQFLGVSVAGTVLIWFVGSFLSPSGIGIGSGWIALAAAFVVAYAVVYHDERAIRGPSLE